jgi:hypothetical protein
MICKVIVPFVSRVDGRFRLPGQLVDVDGQRAGELVDAGVVEAPATEAPVTKRAPRKKTTR